MDATLDSIILLRRAFVVLLVSATLQIVLGGIRFVDGTMLLEFSQRGFDAELTAFSQYLFDSPLKIMLLRGTGLGSPLAIGVLFLLLNAAPLLAPLFVRGNEQRASIVLLLALLPIWKLMFQNVGIGDSVTVLLSIVLVVSEASAVLVIAAILLALWHFQQGVIITAMLCLVLAVRREPGDVRRIPRLSVGMCLGAVLFTAIQRSWVPAHEGRLAFMSERIGKYFPGNLEHVPLAVCALLPVLLILWFSGRWQGKRYQQLAAAFMGGAVALGSLTTDFSRVIVLLSTPLLVLIVDPKTNGRAFATQFTRPSVWLPIALISAVVPFVSWSGIDIYLWHALREDLQKYLGR